MSANLRSGVLTAVNLIMLSSGALVAAQQAPQPSPSLADPPKRPSLSVVESAVRQVFAQDVKRQPKDIISRSEVAAALRAVDAAGWRVPDAERLLRSVLPDDDYLVRQLRTSHGRRFMHRVGGRELMYDRLDRVARVPGGQALVRDLPKLPDADRQADHLEQFLPKMGSGQRRRVPDFDKPTQRIYTVDQLLDTLRKIYASEG